MGELIVFIVVFYVIGKILKLFSLVSARVITIMTGKRWPGLACPDCRIRTCMLLMSLSSYRRLSACLRE